MIATKKVSGFVAALSALTILSAPDAAAQWGSRAGIGYVVNAPNQYVGLSAHVLTTSLGGLGLYLDGKISRPTAESRANFEADWTAQYVDDTFGDLSFGDEHEYVSFNAAVMRPVTPELLVYAGAGYTRRRVYVEYVDQQRERGEGGFYWVEDTDEAAAGANALVGAFFRIGSNVSLQVGFEAQPRGATVGASYSLPLDR